MKPKRQARQLISQQKELDKEMYHYAREDRRDRRAYLKSAELESYSKRLGKVSNVLLGTFSNGNNRHGHGRNVVVVETRRVIYPARKGRTRRSEIDSLRSKQVK